MSLQIIPANPALKKEFQKDGENFLRVSEFYCDTIQGEGHTTGAPAAFLRLQGCSLNCTFCDTTEVWRFGNPYTFKELFDLMEASQLPLKFRHGQNLVITGGSPLMQQDRLTNFLLSLKDRYGYKPVIQIENECVIEPIPELLPLVNVWNNSPKLSNSGVPVGLRYKEDVIRFMSNLKGSYFKFVVQYPSDWLEIEKMFLDPGLIKKEQIVLMPEAINKFDLEIRRPEVVKLAVSKGVYFSDRLHLTIWDKKVGV